ncbi:(2Fe-2S)-binding protein [Actinomycetospora sp. TBRC 11914]|uniref:(2Fe-2S)-binding protein n=1 Tax=Actinomycetospora sp. TBRC 11914 TaxID=2729387 RepID=UPI00145CF3EA|nr:(2Fe-2S)-binding protein [Actinomycetospora sp. TBRC 11914]NMO93782.1 (2Fe-2S)-binding protein [Actinomycetospora sp. TBRC 11914]
MAAELTGEMADVAALEGFFALATGPAEGVDPSWRPFHTLAGDVLDQRIDQVAAQLGGVPRRIAASLLSLSVSARVTALVLGAGTLHGVVPRLHDRLRWRPWSGGPAPLWIERPEAVEPGDDLAATAARELDLTLRPVLDATSAQASVSEQVTWGNVASSLGGALRMLLTQRPGSSPAARALAVGILGHPPLQGLGRFVDEPSHPTGIGFARRTCCLFYRVPGGGTCGDCVLNA